MDLDRYRKDAKRLVRAMQAGDPDAGSRAEEVLGARARERFQLSDALHVIATERGYRSWPEMKRSLAPAESERPVARIGLQPISDYERRAEQLIADAAAGEEEAVRRVRAHVPRLGSFAGGELEPSAARLVVAREYGFQSWHELARTVERVRSRHEGQRQGSAPVLAALEAIRDGDAGRLQQLLDQWPELGGPCHDGAWTTLLEAIAEPDVVGDHLGAALGVDREVVELLISRSASLDATLNLAACFNRVELAAMLLEAGADPCPDPALGLTPLETAIYHGSRAAAELLAAGGISPLALWTVAALGRIEDIDRFFAPDGALLPTAGQHRPNLADVGWPPGAPPRDDPQDILDEALCHAAHNGRTAPVRTLLDRGANVDGRPYLDMTPLHFAVQFGHVSTVRLLVGRGADLTIRDRIHGGTPVGWAQHQGDDELAALLDPNRTETAVESELRYRPGEPVVVVVARRERRVSVSDGGVAVEKAARLPGWRAPAARLERELDVNVSRGGEVWLPVVAAGPGLDAIVRRIAEASLTLYQALLDLDE